MLEPTAATTPVLDRSVLANYQETPYTWDMYCARKVLNDLRLARMFRVDRGAAGAGLSLLAQSPMWDAGPRHSRKEAARAMQTDKEIP